jgi:Pentapeptide repeats (8 copies)
MADFTREDLTGARFDQVDLTGARFRNVDLTGVKISGALLVNLDIDGLLKSIRINGVDVVPLVEAELNRRYPDRAGELPRPPLPGRHPQRGMGAPPLRRTRPRHPRVPANTLARVHHTSPACHPSACLPPIGLSAGSWQACP